VICVCVCVCVAGRRLENPYVRFAVSSIICFGFVRMDEHKDAAGWKPRDIEWENE